MLVNKKYISVAFSEAELKERNNALAILHDIASDLTSSLSLTEIMDRSILKIMEHFSMDVVRMYLMDDSGKRMTLAAYKGLTMKMSGIRRRKLSRKRNNSSFSPIRLHTISRIPR